MNTILQKITSNPSPTSEEIQEAIECLIDKNISDEEIFQFLIFLQKHEVGLEWLLGAANVFRKYAVSVPLNETQAIDTCGTGGDQIGSFNFSTAAALVAAACGVPVAKHGNRAITSQSGSADFLESLGIPINQETNQVIASIQKNHFGFMLAPLYHPVTARVQKIRRSVKGRTIFNYLGPLLNPAKVKRQLVGVYPADKQKLMANALIKLGGEKVWVVCGESGLDEMDITGKTKVVMATPDKIVEKNFLPQEAGLSLCSLSEIKGGSAKENAKKLEDIFNNKEKGPIFEGILYNSAAALCVADRVRDLREGVEVARGAVESGIAWGTLESLRNKL